MLQPYRTIRAAAAAEFTERRSRFIGYIAPVQNEQEALDFLESIRAKHRDATHNCYAYCLREGHLQRFSDDGEPSGTAGRPILEVIQRSGLTDVCVVVTRYFGGILLGTGGLVRAYTESCKVAVDAAEVLHMHPAAAISLTVDYAFYGKLQNLLPAFGAVVIDTDFAENITQRFMLKTEHLPALRKALEEASAGSVSPMVEQEQYYPFAEED